MLDDLAQRQPARGFAHRIDLGDEGLHVAAALADDRTHALIQAAPAGARCILQQLDRPRADAAGREVDDAQKTGVVVRVLDQPQITQRVLDLGTLEKAQAAVDLVRDAGVEQRAFQHPALRIAAVQQRDVASRGAVAVQLLRLFDEPLRFGKVAGGLEHAHLFARAGLGAQVLAQTARVARDQLVGRIEDVAIAAVIALQLDDLLHLELALEVGHVADLRTAKRVDALVVVADREHGRAVRSRRASEHLQPGVLQPVGVLEFVDQDVPEAPLVMVTQARVIAHQLIGAQHQLGEINDAFALALFLVRLVDLHQHAALLVTHLDILRAQAFFLLPGDEPGGGLRHEAFFIELHRLDDAFDR